MQLGQGSCVAWLLVLILQVGHKDFYAAPNSSPVSYVRYVKGRFDGSLQGLDLGGAEWARVSSNVLAGRKMLCVLQPAARLHERTAEPVWGENATPIAIDGCMGFHLCKMKSPCLVKLPLTRN